MHSAASAPSSRVLCDRWGICHYFGASYSSDIPMAARTSSIVSAAALRARSAPASRISQAPAADSPHISCAAPASDSAACTSASAAHPLHSMHPIPADRQPSFTFAIVSLLLKILCRSPTGHTSGFPGSDPPHPRRIGHHRLQLLPHDRLRIGQHDRVPIRLRHLAPVGARQLRRGSEQRLRLGNTAQGESTRPLVDPGLAADNDYAVKSLNRRAISRVSSTCAT